MDEVLPGVWHWNTRHPKIGIEVASYWLDDAGVLIDPLVPQDVGLDWFSSRSTPPRAIVLSIRHHYRESGPFHERFRCPVHVPRTGMHEFTRGEPVVPYDLGDELPGGLVAFEVGALCPDETALHRPASDALWIADGVVRGPGDADLGFVPDSLMDDPEETKAGLLASFSRALDQLAFTHVLLAHGGPVVGDGRAQLRAFVDRGGQTVRGL